MCLTLSVYVLKDCILVTSHSSSLEATFGCLTTVFIFTFAVSGRSDHDRPVSKYVHLVSSLAGGVVTLFPKSSITPYFIIGLFPWPNPVFRALRKWPFLPEVVPEEFACWPSETIYSVVLVGIAVYVGRTNLERIC